MATVRIKALVATCLLTAATVAGCGGGTDPALQRAAEHCVAEEVFVVGVHARYESAAARDERERTFGQHLVVDEDLHDAVGEERGACRGLGDSPAAHAQHWHGGGNNYHHGGGGNTAGAAIIGGIIGLGIGAAIASHRYYAPPPPVYYGSPPAYYYAPPPPVYYGY